MERCTKIEQILISPTSNQLNQSFQIQQSPILLQPVSGLGLTITPLDLSSSKHSSLDQQENSLTTIRPSTQPGYFISINYLNKIFVE
jgi:hypothetical protein